MNAATHVLAVDAGNTRVKWGLHDGKGWFMRGAFATVGANSADMFSHLPDASRIDRIIVSNVAGSDVANSIKDRLYRFGVPVEFIRSPASQCGVTNQYEQADALGTDRWAALIAARAVPHPVSGPQLVVMAGTALTIDSLTATGEFLGGVIVPGPALMHTALTRGTAQLPDGVGEYRTFPRNTLSAISSGAIEACSGAVQRMYTHLSAHTGEVPYCIASGGAIHALAPHLPFPVTINDNLVLDGLIEISHSTM
ncbi:MAG: type III pantothenate kinase [Betaproteobacteria bacterium]|nr:type III pantothenate kinase [Betaproteobacteria bacterium]